MASQPVNQRRSWQIHANSGLFFGHTFIHISRKIQNVRNIRGEKEPVQDIITYHLLRMVMEPKYLAKEVIVHLNQPLTR